MDTKNIDNRSLQNPLMDRVEKRDAKRLESKERSMHPESARGGYNVDLSESALELSRSHSKAFDIAKSTDPIREGLVQRIKSQLASGKYKVDAGKIADGMLQEAIRDRLAGEELIE